MGTALAGTEAQEASEVQGEQRLILAGVSWEQYETLRATLDDHPGLRMFYLEGNLEIMSPSPMHELIKTTLARLFEIYFLEKDIPLIGYGSTTFRAEAKARGLEPDECYCYGTLKEVPDIALEVALSSGGLNKLAIYQGLGVPEVWYWRKDRLSIYRLRDDGYVRLERSELVPALDFDLLQQYVRRPDQHQAVRAFRAALNRDSSTGGDPQR